MTIKEMIKVMQMAITEMSIIRQLRVPLVMVQVFVLVIQRHLPICAILPVLTASVLMEMVTHGTE